MWRKEIVEFEAKPKPIDKPTMPQSGTNIHWSPPPFGTFKQINNSGGVGLIIHDFPSTYRGSKFVYLSHLWNLEEAEAKGLWEAVQWAKEKDLENVVFELDSKLLVEAVNKNVSIIDWRLHNLILEIKELFKIFSSWQCCYVPKDI